MKAFGLCQLISFQNSDLIGPPLPRRRKQRDPSNRALRKVAGLSPRESCHWLAASPESFE